MNLKTPTLTGRHVRLEPIGMQHLPALARVGCDRSIWTWMPWMIDSPQAMQQFIQSAIDQQASGEAITFATIDLATGQAVGSSRYLNISPTNRRLEIGATWIAPAWQRTAVNTEAKLLMLQYAFESLRCMRVEFKTDALNERSRKAILRLGAVEEGTFRKHMIMPGDRVRHSVYFSITDDEWPTVRRRLEEKLAR